MEINSATDTRDDEIYKSCESSSSSSSGSTFSWDSTWDTLHSKQQHMSNQKGSSSKNDDTPLKNSEAKGVEVKIQFYCDDESGLSGGTVSIRATGPQHPSCSSDAAVSYQSVAQFDNWKVMSSPPTPILHPPSLRPTHQSLGDVLFQESVQAFVTYAERTAAVTRAYETQEEAEDYGENYSDEQEESDLGYSDDYEEPDSIS